MKEINWTDEFSVGVAQLDEQHKKIIELINRLIQEQGLSVHSETLQDALSEMLKYSGQHLRYEEKLLRENNYPDFEDHEKFHEAYMEKVGGFSISAFDADNRVPKEVIEYLKNWWENHILNEDMKYKSFFNDKGIY